MYSGEDRALISHGGTISRSYINNLNRRAIETVSEQQYFKVGAFGVFVRPASLIGTLLYVSMSIDRWRINTSAVR